MTRLAVFRRVRQVVAVVLGVGLAFVGFMAFAHTKPGRPLLTLMFGAQGGTQGAKGSCPMGFDKDQDPTQKEMARRTQADKLRGHSKAQGRPALGFKLDATTKADVDAWVTAQGLACKKPVVGADLDCSDVPASVLPDGQSGLGAKSLWFQFDANDKLVSVVALRYSGDAELVASSIERRISLLSKEAGPLSRQAGEATAEHLSAGLLSQARAEFAFQDYYAKTAATQIRPGEYMVTEEYRSLPN